VTKTGHSWSGKRLVFYGVGCSVKLHHNQKPFNPLPHLMKLIGSLTSPFVRKVRIVMAEKKLDYQLELEEVWTRDDISKSNPLGKVPCLVLAGGEAIFDSRVIVEYLDACSPVGRLIPESSRERTEVKTWEALADGLLDAAILARMEQTWPARSPEQRSQAWIDRQMGKVNAVLAATSKGLGDKPWCCGAHLSLADIAVGCALGYVEFRFPELAWRNSHANLARLADKLFARHSFIETAPPVS
jgi:glutathione S-transferase